MLPVVFRREQMASHPSSILLCNAGERAALMRVALGVEPADMVIRNASVVNVYTGEIIQNCPVSIKNRWIAATGPGADDAVGNKTLVVDGSGKTLIPGLIEGHTHTWFHSMDALLPFAMKGGTTTIITETMEFFQAAGLEGVLEFLESMKDQPIKVLGTAPAMISPSKASNGISPADLENLLDRDEIVGLGESYWNAVLQTSETLLPLFSRLSIVESDWKDIRRVQRVRN